MSASMRQRYDKRQVRETARGRWPEIISHLTGIDQSILDGNHHPCPKCGGTDRFRAFNDFDRTGGVICNQCHSSENSDGFATIRWLRGCDFSTAVNLVGEYLGTAPSSNGRAPKSKESGQTQRANGKPVSKHKGPERLERSNEVLTATLLPGWCERKPPITVESVLGADGYLAHWYRQMVVAFDAVDASGKRTGTIVYPQSGRDFAETKKLPARKTHNIAGSKDGLVIPGGMERLKAASTIVKSEGIPDALALYPLLPDDYAVVTNICGAGSGVGARLLAELIEDKQLVIVHDADKPGQDGVQVVAKHAGPAAAEVRSVVLPYPIEKNHGKDLRDWINEGNSWAELQQLIDQAELLEPPPDTPPPKVVEADDDPHRLARVNLERYSAENGGAQLRFFRDQPYVWKPDSNCYVEISLGDLAAKINMAIKREFDYLNLSAIEEYNEWLASDNYDEALDKGPPKAKKVTRQLVNNVLDATKGITRISAHTEPGTWLIDDPPLPAEGIITARNGLIHLGNLASGKSSMVPPTADFFDTTAIPFDFDYSAKCPAWLDFLHSIWRNDSESIVALQQWFGYVVSRETKVPKDFCNRWAATIRKGHNRQGVDEHCGFTTRI